MRRVRATLLAAFLLLAAWRGQAAASLSADARRHGGAGAAGTGAGRPPGHRHCSRGQPGHAEAPRLRANDGWCRVASRGDLARRRLVRTPRRRHGADDCVRCMRCRFIDGVPVGVRHSRRPERSDLDVNTTEQAVSRRHVHLAVTVHANAPHDIVGDADVRPARLEDQVLRFAQDDNWPGPTPPSACA